MSLQLQSLKTAQEEHDRLFSTKILSEILRLNFVIEDGLNNPSAAQDIELLSDEQISSIVIDIDGDFDVIKASHKYGLSVPTIQLIQARYTGMGWPGIARVRILERNQQELINRLYKSTRTRE